MKRAIASLILALLLPVAWAGPDGGAILCSVPSHGIPGELAPAVPLTVTGAGVLSWNGVPISAKQFTEYLDDAKTVDPRPEFHISVAANVPFAIVQPVIEEIQSAGDYWITLSVPNQRAQIPCGSKDLRHRQMPAKLHVAVHANGTLSWNGWPVDAKQFEQYSRVTAKDESQPVVVIRPDQDATYANVIETMQRLLVSGLHDFAVGRYGHFVPESQPRSN